MTLSRRPTESIYPCEFVFSGIAPGYCADGLHVDRRVHPYHACLALPSRHQDASFTTSAALYGRTVASRRRHVPVRQAVRMTGIDLLKVPHAQCSSHDPAIHRPRARSRRVQHVARRRPAARPTEPAKPNRDGAGEGMPPENARTGHAPPRRPASRGGVGPCQTGLLVSVAALSAATIQRAQRADDSRWAGEAGYHISPLLCCFPEVVQRGRGPDVR